MTKEESLYQAKLILECLEFDEYKKIPDETWSYIEDNMEYNPDIVIDPDKPLEEQDIDKQTMDFLEKVLKQIEEYKEEADQEENQVATDLSSYDKEELLQLVEKYKKQSDKVSKAKDLVLGYEDVLKQKTSEVENLKKTNRDLLDQINKCPKIIRKLFFKDFEKKLLN